MHQNMPLVPSSSRQTPTRSGTLAPIVSLPAVFPVEWNCNIYDMELLAIIHALKSWSQYLHRSPFPEQVFTNHKNITYFWQPQVLNFQQAQWLIDLIDFNLKIIHVPGKLLTGTDALSQQPDLLPSNNKDNAGVTLLSPSLFVNLIDTALSHHIQSASSGNPLVPQALQSMHEDSFCSCLANWKVEGGILTYKGHVCVPANDLHHSILEQCHDHESAGHPSFLKLSSLLPWNSGGPDTKQSKHSPNHTPLSPIKSLASCPFQQISCDLITNLPTSAGFNSLLVVTMGLLSR